MGSVPPGDGSGGNPERGREIGYWIGVPCWGRGRIPEAVEALLRRCREHRITLMLNLGDGYYQNLKTGKFFAYEVGTTWPGSADDAATYGRLEWNSVPPLPPRPAQPWPEVPAGEEPASPETR